MLCSKTGLPLSTLSITLLVKNFRSYSCVSHLKFKYKFITNHTCIMNFLLWYSRRMYNLKFSKHLRYLLLHTYWSFVCYLLLLFRPLGKVCKWILWVEWRTQKFIHILGTLFNLICLKKCVMLSLLYLGIRIQVKLLFFFCFLDAFFVSCNIYS